MVRFGLDQQLELVNLALLELGYLLERVYSVANLTILLVDTIILILLQLVLRVYV